MRRLAQYNEAKKMQEEKEANERLVAEGAKLADTVVET